MAVRNRVMEVLTEAVRDFTEHGFDSQERLDRWAETLRLAIEQSMRSPIVMAAELRGHLNSLFKRLVDRGEVLAMHPTVERFTLQRVAPRLHAELNRRIMASVSLVKVNRADVTNKLMQRFVGWATSVPAGGSDQVDKTEVKVHVYKAFKSLPFMERRVLIDQGHKLNAAISATIAEDGGAIAARWYSHWRQANYDYREDHKERDQKIYLIRNSWAQQKGLVKPGDAGYTDQVDQPSERPYCRCRWVFLYHLRQLPAEMLTQKGEAAQRKMRAVA